MAHLQKFKRNQAHAEIAHVVREKKMGDNVDVSLSNENKYYWRSNHPFKGNGSIPLSTQYEERLKELKLQARADVNTLASWVVTLPVDIDANNKKEVDTFFRTTINFTFHRYPQSFIGAGIHVDEPNARPHVHILMIPAVKELKKNRKTQKKEPTGRWKVSAKELYTKADLKSFHQDLSAVLEKELGRKVSIFRDGITEKQGGNRTISQLKLDTEIKKYRKRNQELTEEVQKLKNARIRINMREQALDDREQRLNALQEQINAKTTNLDEMYKKVELKKKRMSQLLTAAQRRIDEKINAADKEIEESLKVKKKARRVVVRRNSSHEFSR